VQQRYSIIVDEEDSDGGWEAQSEDDFRPIPTWTESEIIHHFCSYRQSIPMKDILEKNILPVINEQRRKNGLEALKIETLRKKCRQLCPELVKHGGPRANSGGFRKGAGRRQGKTCQQRFFGLA